MSDNDAATSEFSRLLTIVRELRRRCPWDREQTPQTLGKHLIEEAYEAADALDGEEPAALADELGDLLAQTLFAGVVAEERKRLGVAEVLRAAADKLVRRHPHVYGGVAAATTDEVVANWNRIKQGERRAAGAVSAVAGVARSMPALMRAQKLGDRARQAGMDWADIHDVLAKVREEMDEVEGALARNDPDAAASEIGDMLLALANAPRFIGRDAEETLRRACDKFVARFTEVERLAAERKVDLAALRPNEIDLLWNEAKRALDAED